MRVSKEGIARESWAGLFSVFEDQALSGLRAFALLTGSSNAVVAEARGWLCSHLLNRLRCACIRIVTLIEGEFSDLLRIYSSKSSWLRG